MKTTTIYRILISELEKQGFNYFQDEKTGKVRYLSDEALENKILTYDEDIDYIVSVVLFNNNYIHNNQADQAFKYLWVNRFLNREIKYQSLTLFTAKNTALFYQYANLILAYFRDFDKYLTGETQSETENKSDSKGKTTSEKTDTGKTNNVNLQSSLPQTEVKVDIDNPNLSYADDITTATAKTDNKGLSKTDNTQEGKSTSFQKTKAFDIMKLHQFKKSNILNDILDDFDKECFLQTW